MQSCSETVPSIMHSTGEIIRLHILKVFFLVQYIKSTLYILEK